MATELNPATLAARSDPATTNVSAAIDQLKGKGLIRGETRSRQVVCWHLTQAGITEAMRLIVERKGSRVAA